MSVLDPNEYIPSDDEYSYFAEAAPTPKPTFAQDGPRLAAQGNTGALQRMAQGNSNGRLQMFSDNQAAELRDRMMSRVRTPEQMDQAVERRRGALNKLNDEITQPRDSGSFFGDMMMHSALSRGKGNNWDQSMTYGIGAAMAQKQERQADDKKNRVQAARNNYDFEGIEDKAADASENKAMSELSRIAAAQSKPTSAGRAGATPIKVVGGRAYDFTDPQSPRLVVDRDDFSKTYNEIAKTVNIRANKYLEQGAFDSIEQMQSYIKNQTRIEMEQHISSVAASKGTTQTATGNAAQGVSLPQAGAKPTELPATAQKGNLVVSPEQQSARDAEALKIIQNGIDTATTPEDKARWEADKEAFLKTATTAKPAQVATAAAAVDRPLLSKADQAGQKKAMEENEKGIAEEIGKWRAAGTQADQLLGTYRNVMALRPKIQPGKFADVRKELGGYLGAMGFDGKMVDQANNLEAVSGMLQGAVNDRMTLEKGVQTEGDSQRFQKAFANIKQSPYAFDFMMGMIREQAERAQERVNIADSYVGQNKGGSGISKAWKDYNENKLGPMVVGDIGNGQPMWRHQWIEETTKRTLAKNPGADPVAVKKKAEEAWVNFARSR